MDFSTVISFWTFVKPYSEVGHRVKWRKSRRAYCFSVEKSDIISIIAYCANFRGGGNLCQESQLNR